MATNTPSFLTPAQVDALFDILNHNETYREAESFKHPCAVREYGYPFTAAETPPQPGDPPVYAPESSSPLFQLLLMKCIITFPGMGDLPPGFWSTSFQGIMFNLSAANLSESYDKGTLGTRKTLATGASVIHEALTRGLLKGVPKRERIDLKKARYDTTQAPELARAWDECVHELVHGTLADELFDHCAATADLEAHSPAVAAAVDYAILHLASLMHHVCVASPEGQYLLKLVENVYKLVPFSVVRQTLRIGNAATMLNGMIRVFLAKVGVGAVTNWFGITSAADDGMNLMQKIASMVLYWDASDFRRQATATESPGKDRPPKAALAALKSYTTLPRSAHDALREISTTQQISIVAAILDASDPALTASLSPVQHAHCQEWLSATLSARDRDELTRVLCKSQPDHLTTAVRGAVAAYEPMIRGLHEAMDLREHITSVETWGADFIETGKPKKPVAAVKGGGWRSSWKNGGGKCEEDGAARPPLVEDYVALLRRSKALLFNYCHQFCKDCTSLRALFQPWVNSVVREFRQPDGAVDAEWDIGVKMQALYAQLSAEQQKRVRDDVDAHAAYLDQLNAVSQMRMQHVLDQLAKDAAAAASGDETSSKPGSKACSPRTSSSSTTTTGPSMSGPGMYLMRWTALLDATPITPATATGGAVRCGQDVKGVKAAGKTAVDGSGGWNTVVLSAEEEHGVPIAPDGSWIMTMLGDGFRRIVNGCVGWEDGKSSGKFGVRGGEKEAETEGEVGRFREETRLAG